MSYEKAADLLEFAQEIAARRLGMAYTEIDERSTAPSFEGKRRNTQRLVRALERVFGSAVSTRVNDRNEKHVLLETGQLRDLIDLTAHEMTALDRAIDVLTAANALPDAQSLSELRRKIRLLAPRTKIRKLDVDYEALLHAGYVAVRQGPRPLITPEIMAPVTEAILAVKQLSFDYSIGDTIQRRTVHPYGVVFGHRLYLVALMVDMPVADPSIWRVDRMSNVTLHDDRPADVPDQFDISAYARRSFGAFHRAEEYGEVEWRFSPDVADSALTYRFHPDQTVTRETDGSITVRFKASGLLEMAWALYPWGDHVEVVKPQALREMVDGWQRNDFPAVP